MKAVILEEIKKVSYTEIPTPKPGFGEVLLKVNAVSICGSDIKRVLEGNPKMPLVLGHECSGKVEEVGEGVDSSIIGTKAAIIPLIPCFKCHQCAQGLYSACTHYSFIGSRQNGCFAEYALIPARNIIPIGNNVCFEDAALLEPLTVIIHGLNRINYKTGKNVIVIGAGSLGALAIKWLKAKGVNLIVVSDVDDNRLKQATLLGANIVINPEKVNIVTEVMKITGEGAELVLGLAGTPESVQNAIAIAKPRGKVLLFGNLPKGSSVLSESFEQILRKELSIYGNWMSYSEPFPGVEWQEVSEVLETGSISLSNVISHRFPLSETPKVFEEIIKKNLAFRKIMLFPDNVFEGSL